MYYLDPDDHTFTSVDITDDCCILMTREDEGNWWSFVLCELIKIKMVEDSENEVVDLIYTKITE